MAALTVSIEVWGELEYVSLNLPTNELLPALKNAQQAVGERVHRTSAELTEKRRQLSALIDEIRISAAPVCVLADDVRFLLLPLLLKLTLPPQVCTIRE